MDSDSGAIAVVILGFLLGLKHATDADHVVAVGTIVNEYGNVKPDMLPTEEKREPLIDTLVDEKEKTLKIVAEMPGVEKSDVNVVVGVDRVIHIDAERGEKKYHVKVPINHKVESGSPKATYKNGILELVFKLEDEKSNGTTVNVL